MNRHDDNFSRASIFGGKEQWRADEGEKQGLKDDLRMPIPDKANKTPKYIEGYIIGRDKQKRQMMEDLILGKYNDEETEDIKSQLGLP